MPRVTVLMATWNRADFIGRAIESARSQTFSDWELVVADDGSTDNTAEVVKKLAEQDGRIKYLRLEHCGRVAKTSNPVLRRAKGEYVAILDDDDWWPDRKKLEKQVEFLDKNPDYVGCGGGFITVDGEGKETGRFLKPETDRDIRRVALIANPMANSTTMFRLAAAREAGFYDESLLQFADWDFWLKMGLRGKLYNFQEYFLCYRMWDKGLSFRKQRETSASAITILKRYKNKYPRFLLAACYVAVYWFYARVPEIIKRTLNPPLSRLKKKVFSRG